MSLCLRVILATNVEKTSLFVSRNIKGLLTESEVCTGKYLPEGKYFPVQTEQNEVNKLFIIWLLKHIF